MIVLDIEILHLNGAPSEASPHCRFLCAVMDPEDAMLR